MVRIVSVYAPVPCRSNDVATMRSDAPATPAATSVPGSPGPAPRTCGSGTPAEGRGGGETRRRRDAAAGRCGGGETRRRGTRRRGGAAAGGPGGGGRRGRGGAAG